MIRQGNNRSCWIIDPGGCPDPVIRRIKRKKLRPKMLILTHGHPDHTWGNKQLKNTFAELPIAMHKDDAQAKSIHVRFFNAITSIGSPPPDIFLRNGGKLRLGLLEFTVIHTPGHTLGGICLFCAKSDPPVVFVGDLIMADGDEGNTFLPGGSDKQLKASICKLFRILPDDTVIYPGHGSATTVGEERVYHSVQIKQRRRSP